MLQFNLETIPVHFKHYFTYSSNVLTYFTQNSSYNNLHLPSYSTNKTQKCATYIVPKIWNKAVLEKIKTLSYHATFRFNVVHTCQIFSLEACIDYFLNQCFCFVIFFLSVMKWVCTLRLLFHSKTIDPFSAACFRKLHLSCFSYLCTIYFAIFC